MTCTGKHTREVVWVGMPDPDLWAWLDESGWSVLDGGPHGEGVGVARHRGGAEVALIDLRDAAATDPTQIESVMAEHADLRWIALVRPQSLDSPRVTELIRLSCVDFHTMPIDTRRLAASLGHAWGMARLGSASDDVEPVIRGMVGQSPPMRDLAGCIHKFATVDVPVLITGETGTGKEVAARALHELSSRRRQPFVAINCGALAPNLVQSELFGHERGAFTGATSRKIGRFEAADGGTIFLDEIGDLPLDAQTNLLRFLQEGTIERIGSCESRHVDARITAATHVDLEQAVREGRFREDLYYRLNVLRLSMPPLRERGEDIPRLARHFLDQFRRDHGTRVRGFSRGALGAMAAFEWPGNVRELMNRVRRAAVVADGGLIAVSDLGLAPAKEAPRAPKPAALDAVRASAERDIIVECLRQSRFNVSECARRLNVSRVTVYRLCKKHHVALDAAR